MLAVCRVLIVIVHDIFYVIKLVRVVVVFVVVMHQCFGMVATTILRARANTNVR